MKQRNRSIDIMKGIGILLVVIGHLVYGTSYPFRLIFSFHMPLFFLISGYNTKPTLGDRKFLPLVYKKALGLLVPSMVYANLYHYFDMGHLAYLEVIRKNPLAFVIPVDEWFLTSLFASGLLLWFYVKLESKIKTHGSQFLLGGMVFASSILIALSPAVQGPINSINGYLPFRLGTTTMIAFGFQLIGYFIRNKTGLTDWMDNHSFNEGELAFVIALGVLAGWYTYFNTGVNVSAMLFGKNMVVFYLVALYWCGVIYRLSGWLGRYNLRSVDLLVYLGSVSLYIYIGHGILSRVFKQIVFILWGVAWEPMSTLPWQFAVLYFFLYLLILLPTFYGVGWIRSKLQVKLNN